MFVGILLFMNFIPRWVGIAGQAYNEMIIKYGELLNITINSPQKTLVHFGKKIHRKNQKTSKHQKNQRKKHRKNRKSEKIR